MVYRTVEVEVDVTLDEFDTEELVDELKSRGCDINSIDVTESLTKIYEQRKLGHSYQRELDELIWQVLGRIN